MTRHKTVRILLFGCPGGIKACWIGQLRKIYENCERPPIHDSITTLGPFLKVVDSPDEGGSRFLVEELHGSLEKLPSGNFGARSAL